VHRRWEDGKVLQVLALFRLAVFGFGKLILEVESFVLGDLAFDDFL